MGSIEFRTLGSPDLRLEDGTAVLSVLAQPKRLALLSFMAARGPGEFTRRDTLCATLWPDADQDRARHRLRTALHMLRRAIGHETIVRRGDEEVGLSADMWHDVAALEQAAESQDHEAVLALYRGDFLEGFHVEASHDFEEWQRRTRDRLRRLALVSAQALRDAALSGRDDADALQWSARAREISPLDEGALRDHIFTLDAVGRPADAINEYDAFADRLANEMQTVPAQETVDLIGRVRTGQGLASESTPARDGLGASISAQAREGTAAAADTVASANTVASADPKPAEDSRDGRANGRGSSGRAALLIAVASLGGVAFLAARVSQTGNTGVPQPAGVSLLAYLASWLILVVGIWFLFERAEETASASGRARVAGWLRPQDRTNVGARGWAEGFVDAFDRIFGPKHLSLYCFIRSMAASVVAVTILLLLWIAIRPEQFSTFAAEQGMRGLGELVLITFIVNVVADYLSLLETRVALGFLRRRSAAWARAGVLVADALATLVVWLVFYAGLPFLLLAGVSTTANDIMLFLQFQVWSYAPTIHEVMSLRANGGGPPVGVWFYSTFLTSIWLWAYLGAGQITRATYSAGGAASRGVSRFAQLFDAERQPFRVLGFVVMLVVTAAYGLGWLVNSIRLPQGMG